MDQFVHPNDVQEGIVTVGRTAGRNGGELEPTFTYAWPVEQAVPFNELLREIDKADCELMGIDEFH